MYDALILRYFTALLLKPVLLNPFELPENLDPLDLLPLLELPDEAVTDSEIVKPVLPPELQT